MSEITKDIRYPVYDPKHPDIDISSYSVDGAVSDVLLGILYGLSRNAHDNSVCNKCIKCEYCQNMELAIVYKMCPMHDLVTSTPLTIPKEAASVFGEDKLYLFRALHAKEGIINGYIFDDMQNRMILDSAKWLGIPARAKHPRVFLFL